MKPKVNQDAFPSSDDNNMKPKNKIKIYQFFFK